MAGAIIPVICDTPSCGAVWFNAAIFNLADGAKVQIQSTTAGPCPKCHGRGHIPDGIYQNASAELFSESDAKRIIKALNELKERAINGATADDITDEITSRYPYLSGLKRFLPKTPLELIAYLSLLTQITQCTHSGHGAPTQPVQVQVQVQSVLAQVSSDLKTSPPKIQAPHKGPPGRKGPKN